MSYVNEAALSPHKGGDRNLLPQSGEKEITVDSKERAYKEAMAKGKKHVGHSRYHVDGHDKDRSEKHHASSRSGGHRRSGSPTTKDLLKIIMEDNRSLRRELDALKRGHDHESYTSSTPVEKDKHKTGPLMDPALNEGHGDNGHRGGAQEAQKEKLFGADEVLPKNKGPVKSRLSPPDSVFNRLGPLPRKKIPSVVVSSKRDDQSNHEREAQAEVPAARNGIPVARTTKMLPYQQTEVQNLPHTQEDLRDLIRAEVNRTKGADGTALGLARKVLGGQKKSPLADWIIDSEVPRKFTMPKFVKYDGKSDPASHIMTFDQEMILWDADEALKCRAFPASLGETALRWYSGLIAGSITSYRALTEQFTARFITSSKPPTGLAALMALKQKTNEPLKDFCKRYWDLFNEIEGDWSQVAVASFNQSLIIDSPLYNDLVMDEPATLDALIARANKYIKLEDNRANRARTPHEKFSPANLSSKRKREENQRKEKPSEEAYKGVNTVFKEPIYKVMSKIKDKPFFKWPKAMPSDPSIRNPKKFCTYHKDIGHRTEDCKSLKYFLEDLAKRGHISEFVKEQTEEGLPPPPAQQPGKGAIGVVTVIHSITDPSELTKNAQKNSLKRAELLGKAYQLQTMSIISDKRPRDGIPQELSFSERDLVGVETPHNDALVLTIMISTFDVMRVLIDSGSSSEIIYRKLYKALNIPAKDIIPACSPVYSFSGEAIWPVGKVRLPVRVGPIQRTLEFLIVDIESPYNAIMGRGFLGAMQAVASPYHQKMKLPSSEGIVEVRGSQEQARQCFIMAIRGSQAQQEHPSSSEPENSKESQ